MKKELIQVCCFIAIACQMQVHAQIKISADVHQALLASEKRSFELKEKDYAVAKTELEVKTIQHKYIPTLTATGGIAHFRNDGVLDLAPVSLPIFPIQLFEGSQDASIKGNIMGAGLMAKSVLFSGLQIPKAKQALKTKAEAENLLRDAVSETISRQVLLALDNLQVLNQVDTLLAESKKRLDAEKNVSIPPTTYCLRNFRVIDLP